MFLHWQVAQVNYPVSVSKEQGGELFGCFLVIVVVDLIKVSRTKDAIAV